jgi:hypothetical protein
MKEMNILIKWQNSIRNRDFNKERPSNMKELTMRIK